MSNLVRRNHFFTGIFTGMLIVTIFSALALALAAPSANFDAIVTIGASRALLAPAKVEYSFDKHGSICPPESCTVTVVPGSTPSICLVGEAAANGVFNPSLQYNGGRPADTALSYSSVTETSDIHTSIALWNDTVQGWNVVGPVNAVGFNVSFRCPSGVCVGNWIHEVSSLLFDEGDPNPARRWKAFTHSYMVVNGSQLRYDWGHVSLFTAPNLSSSSTPWVTTALFGWNSTASLSSQEVLINLSNMSELAHCMLFTEPGTAIVPAGNCYCNTSEPTDTCILIALGCVYVNATSGATVIDIVLLSTTDHAQTFQYGSVLIAGNDMLLLNFTVPQVNAADLFWDSGTASLYLIASPTVQFTAEFSGYYGCLVFPLTFIEGHFAISRDNVTGAPLISRLLLPDPIAFSGACTAVASQSGGGGTSRQYLFPTLFPGINPEFRILPSGLNAP